MGNWQLGLSWGVGSILWLFLSFLVFSWSFLGLFFSFSFLLKQKKSHGIVKERMNPAFKGKGKRPIVTYGKVLQQRGISREDAEAYAERRGIVIPEEHFALK